MGLKGAVTELGRTRRRHHARSKQAEIFRTSALMEGAFGRSGTKAGTIHACPARFFQQRFAERQHKGFRGRIDREKRTWLKSCRRCDIEPAASLVFQNARPEKMRQLNHRPDIQIDHTKRGGEISSIEGACRSIAGVVDHDIDIQRTLAERLGKLCSCVELAEIAGNCSCADVKLTPELCCFCLERFCRAGNKHEVISVFGKTAREFEPYTAACTRDESRLALAFAPIRHKSSASCFLTLHREDT